jgi:hypothetical protein
MYSKQLWHAYRYEMLVKESRDGKILTVMFSNQGSKRRQQVIWLRTDRFPSCSHLLLGPTVPRGSRGRVLSNDEDHSFKADISLLFRRTKHYVSI